MRRLIGLTIALLLSGCELAPPQPFSDVVPMGLDTFMLTNEDRLGTSGSSVKAGLYRKANAFCESKGKQLMPVNEQSRDGVPGSGSNKYVNSIPANAEIQFRCLDSNDPELTRPTMKSVPDVQINTD